MLLEVSVIVTSPAIFNVKLECALATFPCVIVLTHARTHDRVTTIVALQVHATPRIEYNDLVQDGRWRKRRSPVIPTRSLREVNESTVVLQPKLSLVRDGQEEGQGKSGEPDLEWDQEGDENKSSDPDPPKVVEDDERKPGDLGQEQAWEGGTKESSDLKEAEQSVL